SGLGRKERAMRSLCMARACWVTFLVGACQPQSASSSGGAALDSHPSATTATATADIVPASTSVPHAAGSGGLGGVYRVKPTFSTFPMGHFPGGVALVDFDRDGFRDLVVSNGNDVSPQPVVIYRNKAPSNGLAAFDPWPTWYSDDFDYH